MTSEIGAELRSLVSGRVGFADGIIPPVLFVAVNAWWGLIPAAVAGIGSAFAITILRLVRGRPVRFALAGLAGTGLAVVFALRTGSAESYFLPGIISGAATTAALVVSLPMRRPAVALTSWLTRGWPIDWYWHPQVRPAYARATVMWAVFFGLRTIVQLRLFADGEVAWLGVMRAGLGWPALLVLLIATYVFGRRWLESLGGPSVDEFRADSPPPWEGQKSGF